MSMKIGPFIRRLMGPFELPIAEAYRNAFFNVRSFIRQIKSWQPSEGKLAILDIGCGEGILANYLTDAYHEAHLTGIDIIPATGRLFRGDNARVVFKRQTLSQFILKNPRAFDLLVICDVMHHVPEDERRLLLIDAVKTLKPGGSIVFKEWERDKTLVHRLVSFLDRHITGDSVLYGKAEEWSSLITALCGPGSIKAEARIRPWPNNIVFLIQPESLH